MTRPTLISALLVMLFSGCVQDETDTAPTSTPDTRPNILLIIGVPADFNPVKVITGSK